MSIFSDVLVRKPGRSLFNLSHERKFSCDWSHLIPICCLECVPGDTFKISSEVLVRTAPLIAPIMHRVNVKFNYFFVPNRLIWTEFKDFITGINQSGVYDPTSSDQSNYYVTKVPPYFSITDSTDVTKYLMDGSLADFLGFPTLHPGDTSDVSSDHPIDVQVLPFRAYQKIYNDWFRNQNVESEQWHNTTSGLQTTQKGETFALRKRMWEKDYFTSALPFAQRGDAVQIPFTQSFSIDRKLGTPATLFDPLTGNSITPGEMHNNNDSEVTSVDSRGITSRVGIDNSDNLKVSGGVNLGTINDLRLATRLQRWLEINARVGGRYIEQILGHFGVHSSDARLDRSEYLGGYNCPIVVSDIEQTSASLGSSQSGDTTPQGNLAGKGTAYTQGKPIKCFCEEHGFIIGIMSILPRTSYQDGLPKMFQRNYKEDYYFPEFANLGEQEINKNELLYSLEDYRQRESSRFGFQERYCEYKYIPSTVHGEFKNNLQFWHLGRSFSEQPALTQTFVTANPRKNIFAVEEGVSHFYCNLINHITALRPMPKQSIPTL